MKRTVYLLRYITASFLLLTDSMLPDDNAGEAVVATTSLVATRARQLQRRQDDLASHKRLEEPLRVRPPVQAPVRKHNL
jgi:hypothetical protein